jgi:type III secretion protein C
MHPSTLFPSSKSSFLFKEQYRRLELLRTRSLKNITCCLLSSLSFFCANIAIAAVPTHWKDSGFSINADGMTLVQVLNNFANAYGVHVVSKVQGDSLLKGRLQAATGTDFLDRLGLSHRFRWFVYNDMLYIVPMHDFTALRIQLDSEAISDAKAALAGIGLLDPRFGWGEFPTEGAILVTGPREYTNLVKSILLPDGERVDKRERAFMVFRLKYASATDRETRTRDKTEIVAGVKTILSGLLQKKGRSKSASPSSIKIPGAKPTNDERSTSGEAREIGQSIRTAAEGRAGTTGQVDLGRATQDQKDLNELSAVSKGRTDNSEDVYIEADSSLNAIIIYDEAGKRAMYQSLIDEIDIEPQQIEIEALIVDINRNDLSQLGAEWAFSLGNVTTTMNSTGTQSVGASTPLAASTLLIRNSTSFYARLNALENKDNARILAKPTVLTIENAAAVLDLSNTRYVPLVGERVADLANITAGTMLKVVPRIVEQGQSKRIRLDISIEDGSVEGATDIKRSTISTQAIIDTNHTLLIGGYHSESKDSQRRKVPFFGDLPFVGKAFQNSSDNISNRERLFLITPRLISRAENPAPQQSRAHQESRKVMKDEIDQEQVNKEVKQLD